MSAAQKLVVWDWNGTLLNDGDAMVATANAMLSKLNLPQISEDFLRDNYSLPLRNFYQLIGITDAMFDESCHIYHEHYERLLLDVSLRQGVPHILDQLKMHDISSIILSNHMTDKITDQLKKHAIEDHFDHILAYKGHGDIYWTLTKGKILQQHIEDKQLDHSQAIIIGDTTEEIEIAKALGLTSVAITGGMISEHRLRALNPDYLIHSMEELTPILQERGYLS